MSYHCRYQLLRMPPETAAGQAAAWTGLVSIVVTGPVATAGKICNGGTSSPWRHKQCHCLAETCRRVSHEQQGAEQEDLHTQCSGCTETALPPKAGTEVARSAGSLDRPTRLLQSRDS